MPVGSQLGFRRPVIVIQGNALTRSQIATVLCVPLTSNMNAADYPGNVGLAARSTGLPKDSVANVSQIAALDRVQLDERIGAHSRNKLSAVLAGVEIVLSV